METPFWGLRLWFPASVYTEKFGASCPCPNGLVEKDRCICASGLLGYLSKGPDRLRSFISKKSGQPVGEGEDQILDYLTGRQVTCGEAMWRIFGFGTNVRQPPVSPLNFDVQGKESVDPADPQATVTDLQRYFMRPGSASAPTPLATFGANVAHSMGLHASATMEDVKFQDYFDHFSCAAFAP
eukprot:gene12144-biopygen5618